jgi:hypothetical protein
LKEILCSAMTKRERQIRQVAAEMTRNHGISRSQTLQMARKWMDDRDMMFSPENIIALARKNELEGKV